VERLKGRIRDFEIKVKELDNKYTNDLKKKEVEVQ
jgi:hypothetical protein